MRPYADHLIEIPSVSTLFQPLLSTIPLQVFAASVARARATTSTNRGTSPSPSPSNSRAVRHMRTTTPPNRSGRRKRPAGQAARRRTHAPRGNRSGECGCRRTSSAHRGLAVARSAQWWAPETTAVMRCGRRHSCGGRGAGACAILLNPEHTHPGALAAFRAVGGRVVQHVPAATDLVIDGVVGISGKGPLRPAAAVLSTPLSGRASRWSRSTFPAGSMYTPERSPGRPCDPWRR